MWLRLYQHTSSTAHYIERLSTDKLVIKCGIALPIPTDLYMHLPETGKLCVGCVTELTTLT